MCKNYYLDIFFKIGIFTQVLHVQTGGGWKLIVLLDNKNSWYFIALDEATNLILYLWSLKQKQVSQQMADGDPLFRDQIFSSVTLGKLFFSICFLAIFDLTPDLVIFCAFEIK